MEIHVIDRPGYQLVEFSGFLDFESTNKYEGPLRKLLTEHKGAVFVFDFSKLNFVGSSGVSTFIKMLAALNHYEPRPRFHGVGSEFMRLFKAFQGTVSFAFIDSMDDLDNVSELFPSASADPAS